MKEDTPDMPDIPPDRGDDLRHLEHMKDADLVLFMAGNQFMVMDELLAAFRQEHEGIERIFCETLPPGLELRQILAGGARFRRQILRGDPDVYTSVTAGAMERLARAGLASEHRVYLHNRIVLMVPEGNPTGIAGVGDLARDDVRISQPGELEDISGHIANMYRATGGEDLVRRILTEKRNDGTTVLTQVHHRETPRRLIDDEADVGPVWATEVVYAQREGLRIEAVEPGEGIDQRDRVNYFVTKLEKAPNPANAETFFDFILSPGAQEIYRRYGFLPR
jgi:ABC-type molybdate transport system substrate-binding protein